MGIYTGSIELGKLVQEIANKMKLEGWTEHKFMQTFVPSMTTATSHPDFEIIQSRNYSTYYHYEAFDDVLTDNSRAWWGYTADLATNAAWLGIKILNGKERAIIGYAVTSSCDNNKTDEIEISAPKAWVVQGSDNGTAWTDIHSVTNQVDWYKRERRSFSFTASAVFKQYRIVFKEVNGGSYIKVQRLEFFDADSINTSTFRVMKSKGSSGTDDIVVYFRNPQIAPPSIWGNYFEVGFAEGFNETNQALKNEYMWPYYLTGTNSQTTTFLLYLDTMIGYDMKITKDSVFVATYTNPGVNSPANNCFYAGLMKRHSNEGNNWGQILAIATYGPSSSPRVLKNKQGILDQYITNRWLQPSVAPSVWDNTTFISPAFLEGINEGMRGEYEDLYVGRLENMMNGDEVVVDGARYKAVVTNVVGNNQFPTSCILFRIA